MDEEVKIYRATLKNRKGFIGDLPVLYFTNKETADLTLSSIMSIVKDGRDMEWECMIVSSMDMIDAQEYIKEIIKNGIHMN